MDIEKLKILLPTFYEKLRTRNYGDGYIGKYQYVAKSLFDIVENDKSLNTYEKAYSALMARRPYKKDSIRDYRRLIGHFKAFEEEGIFGSVAIVRGWSDTPSYPNNTRKRNIFAMKCVPLHHGKKK